MLRSIVIALSLTVAAPTVALAQAQAAQVTCKDGSMSHAGRGACSHHGGVAGPAATQGQAPTPAPPTSPPPLTAPSTRAPAAPSTKAPAAPSKQAPVSGQPTARCKDGSMSYSLHHSGSCSHHGGVAQWLQ
jgi:hypothetical protein